MILLDSHFPSLLKNNPLLQFRLRCRKFIELVGQHDLNGAMSYGQSLQNLYKTKDKHIQETLIQTFSLLAYSNPQNSALAHLLQPSARECLAEQVNSAILGNLSIHQVVQGKPAIAALENVVKQSLVVSKELLNHKVPQAALLDVRKDVLEVVESMDTSD